MSKLLIKQPAFNVWSDELLAKSKIHVEVKGLGVVTINRTHEGVIIDVFDQSENNESLASIALEDSDFNDFPEDSLEAYVEEVNREIEKFEPSLYLSQELCIESHQNGTSIMQFIETFYKRNWFDLEGLIPIKGDVIPFSEQVKALTRPYIKITASQYKALEARASNFFKTKGGKVVAFGTADCGYALMPLTDEAAQKVLDNQ